MPSKYIVLAQYSGSSLTAHSTHTHMYEANLILGSPVVFRPRHTDRRPGPGLGATFAGMCRASGQDNISAVSEMGTQPHEWRVSDSGQCWPSITWAQSRYLNSRDQRPNKVTKRSSSSPDQTLPPHKCYGVNKCTTADILLKYLKGGSLTNISAFWNRHKIGNMLDFLSAL